MILRGSLGLANSYGMMMFLIGIWCCALESAWKRSSAIKVQNRIESLHQFDTSLHTYLHVYTLTFLDALELCQQLY